jgi:hypothetical protein
MVVVPGRLPQRRAAAAWILLALTSVAVEAWGCAIASTSGRRLPEATRSVQAASREKKVALAIAGGKFDKPMASEFLCNPGGQPSHLPCLPADFAPPRLRPPAFNGDDDLSAFFFDHKTLPDEGKDEDGTDGVESAHLVFYVGHGDESSWTAYNDADVPLSKFSAGDLKTRYFLMASCNVMAHGPNRPLANGTVGDFTVPQDFMQGRNGDENVFERWGKNYSKDAVPRIPLNRRLRLACGGSTQIGDGIHPAAAFWHYKTSVGLPVADSFILSFAHRGRVPLCITRGNEFPEDTPLYDQEIATEPSCFPQGDHLYIQYPVRSPAHDAAVTSALVQRFGFAPEHAVLLDEPPDKLPVLVLAPAGLPAPLRVLTERHLDEHSLGFKAGTANRVLDPATASRLLPAWTGHALHSSDVCLRWQPKSGAAAVSWRPLTVSRSVSEHLLSPADLMEALTSLQLTLDQWTGRPAETSGPDSPSAISVTPLLPSVEVLRMQIDSAVDLARPLPDHRTKCVYIRLSSLLRVGETAALIFGEGGQWLLEGCPRARLANPGCGGTKPDGDACDRQVPPVLTVAWAGRQVTRTEPPSPVMRIGMAREKAKAFLAARESAYEEVGHRWGYKAAPTHCGEEKMYVFYQFDYEAKAGEAYKNDPPVTIEILAHKLGDPAAEWNDAGLRRAEESWSCSPNLPAPP